MSTYFDGTADIYRNEARKARKDHTCGACNQKIPKGAIYHSCASLFDGQWASWKRCDRCEAIYQHLCSLPAEWDEGPEPLLDCGHSYEEIWGKPPPPEIAALAFLKPGELSSHD